MESIVPGIADIFIATAGNQTVSYDLSGQPHDIIQRIDRQYSVGDVGIFARPDLQDGDISLITRSGKNGYSCYIKGNEFFSFPPNALSGYTDCKFPFRGVKTFCGFEKPLSVLFLAG